MFRKEVNEHSPVRLLEKSIHGGLGPGNLGVVMARAGVGKTAFLVQVGLDDALRERNVLHVSLEHAVDRVRQWWDEVFHDLTVHVHLEDPQASRLLLERHRMIQTYGDGKFSAARLSGVVTVLREHVHFTPAVILIDAYDWEKSNESELLALKDLARDCAAELWLTARTHRHETGPRPEKLPPPCQKFHDLVDVAVFLQPAGNHVELRLMKDHDSDSVTETTLALHPETMRLADLREEGEYPPVIYERSEYTLFSGAATGTEAAFGEVAASFGIKEVNFTFDGHNPARDLGLQELGERELRQGDVSLAYVSRRMNRSYTSSPTFRKVLQSIWHQVNRSQQVLVVGLIQEDGTVKGGTGWGAELARLWNKPLWVFDQEKNAWFRWNSLEETWNRSKTPRLIAQTFCGTGTRFLTDEGRKAIEAVFETTFSTV
jgi:hypothetical protein